MEKEWQGEEGFNRICPLKPQLCLASADCPDIADGEGEIEAGDEGWGPSEMLIRLFRASRLSGVALHGPCPPFSLSEGLRGTFLAGGVCSIMAGDISGLRITGGLMGSCLVRATCWLFTYLALSASRRSTALSLRAPVSGTLRK